MRRCISSGAGLADLWRYLVLWEFGGIYTDTDSAPGPLFYNGTIINDDTDVLMEVEDVGSPSQYFMVASPRHPIMYMAVKQSIKKLLAVPSISAQYVPKITGPVVVKNAVRLAIGMPTPGEGDYIGIGGRKLTMVGSTQTAKSKDFIIRVFNTHQKQKGMKSMNMTGHLVSLRQGQKGEGNQNKCLVESYQLYRERLRT